MRLLDKGTMENQSLIRPDEKIYQKNYKARSRIIVYGTWGGATLKFQIRSDDKCPWMDFDSDNTNFSANGHYPLTNLGQPQMRAIIENGNDTTEITVDIV